MIANMKKAESDLHCDRCLALGIKTPTILSGQDYMMMRHEETTKRACLDCFERLEEQLDVMA